MAVHSKDSFLRRLECTTRFEVTARNECGAIRVGGIDECARGNWAAETCAACVILPDSLPPELDGKLRDSKLISPKKRAALAKVIKQYAIAWNVATVSVQVIDEVGIHKAAVIAMEFAVHGMAVVPDYLLIDAVKIDIDIPQLSINHGDALSVSIAAASILAKTHHTALMEEYDRQFPQYGFIRHKGYGTKEHVEAIRKYGLTPIHRRSFEPIKNFALLTAEVI